MSSVCVLTHSHTLRAATCNQFAADKRNLTGNGVSTINSKPTHNFCIIWLRAFLHPSNHSDVAMTYVCQWLICCHSKTVAFSAVSSISSRYSPSPPHPPSVHRSIRSAHQQSRFRSYPSIRTCSTLIPHMASAHSAKRQHQKSITIFSLFPLHKTNKSPTKRIFKPLLIWLECCEFMHLADTTFILNAPVYLWLAQVHWAFI